MPDYRLVSPHRDHILLTETSTEHRFTLLNRCTSKNKHRTFFFCVKTTLFLTSYPSVWEQSDLFSDYDGWRIASGVDDWKMNMHNRWNNTDRGKWKCSEKNTPIQHFAHHEFHINRPAIEPGTQWRETVEWLPRTWLVDHNAEIWMTVNSRAEPKVTARDS